MRDVSHPILFVGDWFGSFLSHLLGLLGASALSLWLRRLVSCIWVLARTSALLLGLVGVTLSALNGTGLAIAGSCNGLGFLNAAGSLGLVNVPVMFWDRDGVTVGVLDQLLGLLTGEPTLADVGTIADLLLPLRVSIAGYRHVNAVTKLAVPELCLGTGLAEFRILGRAR